MIEVVGGVLEVDSNTLVSVTEFSLDETFDYGEVRNVQYATYANLIEGQTSWSATATVELYADEGTDAASTTFTSDITALRTAARGRNTVTVNIEYGGAAGLTGDSYGDLDYSAVVESADAKITSMSYEGTFFADGEAWSTELEMEGLGPFS